MMSALANWAGPDILQHRIDAEYYSDDAVRSAEWMVSGSLNLKTISEISSLITDGAHKTPTYVEAGVPFLSSTNIDEFHVNLSKGHKYVSESEHRELKKANCSPQEGDILVAKSGRVGTAAVNSSPREFSVFEGVAFVRVTEGWNPLFLSAFLNSRFAQAQIFRSQKGAVQKHLHLEELREIVVPKVIPELQKSIGNKIHKAERLRELARANEQSVDSFFNSVVPTYPSSPEIVSWVDISTLSERMDPQPYRTHALALLGAIRSIPHGVLGQECQVSGGCAVPSEEFLEEEGIPLIRIRDIGGKDFDSPGTFVSRDYYSANSRYAASESEIVVGMDGNFRAQFFLSSDLPAFINQRVAIIRTDGVRPEFLSAWLNRPEGQIQLYRTSVKTTVEHMSLVDVRNVLFPKLEEGEEACLADLIRASREFTEESSQLVEHAKQDVEALIAGALDEAHLLEESAKIEQWLKDNPVPTQ